MSINNFNMILDRDLNLDEILDRVASVEGFLREKRKKNIINEHKTAKALDTDMNNLTNWKNRNSIPFLTLLTYSIKKKIDFVWLLTAIKLPHGSESNKDPNNNIKSERDLYRELAEERKERIEILKNEVQRLKDRFYSGKREDDKDIVDIIKKRELIIKN